MPTQNAPGQGGPAGSAGAAGEQDEQDEDDEDDDGAYVPPGGLGRRLGD